MRTRLIAGVLGGAVVAFVVVFIWAGLRGVEPGQATTGLSAPAAIVSDQLSDGRIEAQVYALGNRDVRLEIRFTPNADSALSTEMRPDVNFAMANMHMDGFEPPLELVKAGVWRTSLKLPMAGRWIVNIGFGEEFAEVEFDAN